MNENELKNEDVLKNCHPTPQQFCQPPSFYDITWMFLMPSHLDSHTTTDVKPYILSDVKTGNGISYDTYNVVALPMCAQTKKWPK